MLPACLPADILHPTSYIPNHRVHNIFYRSHEFDMSWDQHTSGVECVRKKKEAKEERRKKKKGKKENYSAFRGTGFTSAAGSKKKIGHRIFIIVFVFHLAKFP